MPFKPQSQSTRRLLPTECGSKHLHERPGLFGIKAARLGLVVLRAEQAKPQLAFERLVLYIGNHIIFRRWSSALGILKSRKSGGDIER